MQIRTLFAILALVPLVSCGYSEEQFTLDYADAWCNKADECELLELLGWDVDSCFDNSVGADETGSVGDSDCDFQPAAGKACVDEVNAVTCEAFTTGAGMPACAERCG